MSAGSRCQVSPPSLERKTAAGLVPASTVSGSSGITSSDQITRSFSSLSSWVQWSPPSVDR